MIWARYSVHLALKKKFYLKYLISLQSGKEPKKKMFSVQLSLEAMLSWNTNFANYCNWNSRYSSFRMEIPTHLIFKKKHSLSL